MQQGIVEKKRTETPKLSLRAALHLHWAFAPMPLRREYAGLGVRATTSKIIAGRGWIDLKGHDGGVWATGAPPGWFGHAGQAVGPDTTRRG
jgi:hypothetical protein